MTFAVMARRFAAFRVVSSISTLTSGVGRWERGFVDVDDDEEDDEDVAVVEVIGIWFCENELRMLCRRRSLVLTESRVADVDTGAGAGAGAGADDVDDAETFDAVVVSFCLRKLDSVGCANRYFAY
jgi:hypothetical protein